MVLFVNNYNDARSNKHNLHSDILHNLWALSHTLLKWVSAICSTHGRNKKCIRMLSENTKVRDYLNVCLDDKSVLKCTNEIGWEGMNWIQLAHRTGSSPSNAVPTFEPTKSGMFETSCTRTLS